MTIFSSFFFLRLAARLSYGFQGEASAVLCTSLLFSAEFRKRLRAGVFCYAGSIPIVAICGRHSYTIDEI